MSRFTEKIIFITKLSVQITLLILLLELLFNGVESIKDLSVDTVIIQFLIVFIFGLISDPLGTRVSKYNSALSDNSKIASQFSGFTKFIIYILGLPLAGIMISPIILELMVLFGFKVDYSSIAPWVILFVWVSGVIACKYIFFKTRNNYDGF